MIQIPGKIPVIIHPFFWIFSGILGWLVSGTLMGMLIWVGIIFFSVLFHEFGHALTALVFNQEARIQLIALGGVTSFEGPKLKFWQQFLITLNGPLFGFLLFLGATVLLQFQLTPMAYKIFKATQVANLFWSIINLLPVLPLDGGQLLRIVLEACFGVKGFKAALLVGALLAIAISLYFFLVGAYLVGAFFFLFAYQSFDSWRRSRLATKSDREEENKHLMVQAEQAFQEGNKEEAKKLFEEVRNKASGGMLALAATQYLAFLIYKEGKRKEAYEMLLPYKEQLSDDILILLHELAAEEKNYPLVIEISQKCYQTAPSQKMALNNSRAYAHEGQPKFAGGWLQTAWQFGGLNLPVILEEEEFKAVVQDPEFQEFIPK
ncbi:MAG: hypothetical protein A3D96_00290 [Chlamydiae bacterium RIFCSPHIGHO2_12_FULL_44_59]|nr:MAG: hypothetical protein A2796_07435 [Chlamydiae bacterium RIFCSPHIGHO2_01_FULL_44_39]OGN60821.1 MAG: hypothetical protein A3D96_00290 [Chlamydiae bacterium RIFCSPHIGHO2_12_FULL_44_59]OGN66697.1 MAG: hypothetical protein A2978_02925 [Chlamydiae bacterium RIFCSPLOWO2_01_FULL_44_52]OGN67347.1 MAG: hypothetical protein A3I67_06120 [Chlamydiae bacterium RIFCSPLOWO2_02_FULL_45_22]OGN70622.1 MAG: hypothetical protein A3F79_07035 [Chlamydiae bacterium RIFCSPLOWO2_12_FULL_45_20]